MQIYVIIYFYFLKANHFSCNITWPSLRIMIDSKRWLVLITWRAEQELAGTRASLTWHLNFSFISFFFLIGKSMHAAVFFPPRNSTSWSHTQISFLKNGHFKMLMIRSRSTNGGWTWGASRGRLCNCSLKVWESFKYVEARIGQKILALKGCWLGGAWRRRTWIVLVTMA